MSLAGPTVDNNVRPNRTSLVFSIKVDICIYIPIIVLLISSDYIPIGNTLCFGMYVNKAKLWRFVRGSYHRSVPVVACKSNALQFMQLCCNDCLADISIGCMSFTACRSVRFDHTWTICYYSLTFYHIALPFMDGFIPRNDYNATHIAQWIWSRSLYYILGCLQSVHAALV